MSEQKKRTAYLLAGGNLGDRRALLLKAIAALTEQAGTVSRTSKIYETEAWGVEDQPTYLNQAIEVQTSLTPNALLLCCQRIEIELGRVRETKWGSRLMDIDILFYESEVVETSDLSIPHPQLHRRNFALIPLIDLIPEFEHPVLKQTVEDLYWNSEDTLEVYLLDE